MTNDELQAALLEMERQRDEAIEDKETLGRIAARLGLKNSIDGWTNPRAEAAEQSLAQQRELLSDISKAVQNCERCDIGHGLAQRIKNLLSAGEQQ